ncbi:hypothetical protein [Thermoanaerobacterium sp. DL9XJH110]|uniref:hypothetical protein n=1 Tax=Thermoanaerobacterium sp. DL9XJH110 TaxID=3386643 RepID=UPI003BB693D5
MAVLGFLIIMGVALVAYYLFLRKLFNEDRFKLIDDKAGRVPGEKIPAGKPGAAPSDTGPPPGNGREGENG